MKHLHTIPVIPGSTPQRTWKELVNVGVLVPPAPDDCQWTNVWCDGTECERIAR